MNKSRLFIVALLLVMPQLVSADNLRLAERINMTMPEGMTRLENNHQWCAYRGYNDSVYLKIYIIPKYSEMPDGNKGEIADRFKHTKTLDTIFLNNSVLQCIDTVHERFYQWTKDYVKKTYRALDSSEWKYVYTFASHTPEEMVLVIVETTMEDSYKAIDSFLSTFEYKPTFINRIEHGMECAIGWWILWFIVFMFWFIIAILSDESKALKIAICVVVMIVSLFIVSGGNIVDVSAALVFVAATSVFGFIQSKAER